ncbi:MAG: adenylate/guanylate cyclase domain-containing protein, partial [Ferruginibacter sp.]
MASSRQLKAIMFADIAGYTALMQEDEETGLRLRDKFQRKLQEVVSAHYGRILEFKGDGALCSFTSTIEAVRAAIDLQLDMQVEPEVPLRIGMHTGDVVVERNNIYGDGVNIASRIETFAKPGSIFISGKAYDDIKNQKTIEAISLGKFALKNVKDNVEIFAISNAGIKIPDVATLKGKGEKVQTKSIMVLPFINMSNDQEQEYFSDGLTEELISNLTRLKNIKIISRTTSMLYKGTNKDVKTISDETGASYIMEGSVRKQDNNLRITAQFIDSKRDIHLWAESYRGTMDDVFDIQEKVSVKIVEALQLHLTGSDKNMLEKRYTDDTEAYQLYLQGRFFWTKRNADSLTNAVKYFEKAIEKDSDYALAWAGLADTYSLMGEYTNTSRREVLAKQTEAINKALQIDNRLGEAHISLAISLMLNQWDWKNSEKEFKIGIELSPNYATGHHWYAELLLFIGNTEEAFKEITIAVDIDPVSPGILKDKGIHFYYNRKYDDAIELADKALDLDPEFIPAYRLRSLAYQAKGMIEEAIAENERWGRGLNNKLKT